MVPIKKLPDLSLHFRIFANTSSDPPLKNRFGILPFDDRRHDFRRRGVVGAVQGDRADGIFVGGGSLTDIA